jgi:hypothetical protein
MIYPSEYFANFPETTVVTDNSGTIIVASTLGFPAAPAFRIRIEDEILIVTAINTGTNTFTVLRGQEGTVSVSHPSGAKVYHILTAGGLDNAIQTAQSLRSGVRLAVNNTGMATFNVNVSAGIIYLAPYWAHNLVLHDGTAWRSVRVQDGEISITPPNTTFQIFDIFANISSGGIALSTVNWNRVTASLSGTITAAYEPTITTSTAHGLSTNDVVTFTGVGTGTNQIGNLINNRPWYVTVLTTTTFKLQSCDAASPYVNTTGSGTMIKLNNTRATAITSDSTNGILCKNTNILYRYLGTAMTWETAGVVYDTPTKRLLWNADNQVNIYQNFSVSSAHNLSGMSGFRIWNLNYDGQIVSICGNSLEPAVYSLFGDISITSAASCYLGLALNNLSYSALISANINTEYIYNTVARVLMPRTGFNMVSAIEFSLNTATLTNLGLDISFKG